jgi:hypothetical protein
VEVAGELEPDLLEHPEVAARDGVAGTLEPNASNGGVERSAGTAIGSCLIPPP